MLHGWEMTGDEIYWRRIREYVDTLASHQAQPPDGRPPDGSRRQNWALYDPNETLLAGGASPWITAILLSALFHAWLVTADDRIPAMVTRWCDFLDRKGSLPTVSELTTSSTASAQIIWTMPAGRRSRGWSGTAPSSRTASRWATSSCADRQQRERFKRRFERLFTIAVTIDANSPIRCYKWAFQASSQLVWFMNQRDRRIQ